jgi:hypothetical protein
VILGEDGDDMFLTTAVQAMRGGDGTAALDALGWWELLPELSDEEARRAVFAVFRAQGRTLAASPALGGIVAQPYLAPAGVPAGSVVAALRRRSPRRGPVWVLVGDPSDRSLLFDVPGEGAYLVDVAAVDRRDDVTVPGRLPLCEVTVDLSGRQPFLAEKDAAAVRATSTYLGRVAAAAEMLGAAEQAVDLAAEHAGAREQFGQPIGTFQAVRHLLAWAKTGCVALDTVWREALLLLDNPPPRFDEVLKALAGRNGRRACERSLQVLGGIGFTAEHDHHHHHSRVLLLDALLGTSADLSHGLGAWLRTSGTDPGFAAAVLVPGHSP